MPKTIRTHPRAEGSGDAVAFFDKDAEAYLRRTPQPSDHLENLLPHLKPGSRVLDIGCGPGIDANHVAAQGHRVVGVDAAPRMIEVARREFPRVEFRVADMRNLPFDPKSFDAIMAICSIIFLSKREVPAVLEGFAKLLVPGGLLFLAVQGGPSRDRGPHQFVAVMDREELSALVRDAGLSIVGTFERPPRRDEMPYQKLQVLARKR